MNVLIIVLISASLVQATILPIDLVLIILICRSYLKFDKASLFLAFAFGLINDHLNLTTLGLTSLAYLITVAIVGGLSKSRLAGNSLLIIPLTFILLLVNQTALSPFTDQQLNLLKIFLESLISLPVYYLVKLWEERFIVRKEIKLKV